MLWMDLIDIGFFIAGLCIGIIVMAAAASSGYTSKCDDCDFRRYHDERK